MIKPVGDLGRAPAVTGQSSDEASAICERSCQLSAAAAAVLAETENGIKYNFLQYNSKCIRSCPHLMMASSNLSDMINSTAVCILILGLASFRSMAANPGVVQLDCSYWDGELDTKCVQK